MKSLQEILTDTTTVKYTAIDFTAEKLTEFVKEIDEKYKPDNQRVISFPFIFNEKTCRFSK
jgi:hypothetical protein